MNWTYDEYMSCPSWFTEEIYKMLKREMQEQRKAAFKSKARN